MEFASPESIKALMIALEKEKVARETYEIISKTTSFPGTSAIADVLAEEEKKHFMIISGLLEDATENRPIRKIEHSSIDPEIILVGKLDQREIRTNLESEDTKKMLQKAREKEEDSFKFYSKTAHEVEDKTAQEIYDYLAGEENKHYIMIDNIIDFISAPGRWLYVEENLIFQNG